MVVDLKLFRPLASYLAASVSITTAMQNVQALLMEVYLFQLY